MQCNLVKTALVLSAVLAVTPALAAAPDFTFSAIDGPAYNSSDWRGHPVLVVNTASLCGFAPQLTDLQALADRYADKGLVVLAVPSDDFQQELENGKAAKAFCELTYGIDLPMTDITPVKGPQAHPFYQWLAKDAGFVPGWNFNKVLLDGTGAEVGTWGATTKPGATAITSQIDALLD